MLVLVPLCISAAHAGETGAEVRKFLLFDADVVALRHVRVIDGTGAAPQEDRVVIVRGGQIERVGGPEIEVPAQAKSIDLRGRTLLPGLIGMHDHLMYTASIHRDEDGHVPPPGRFLAEVAFTAPRLYLAGGVTTLRTTGSIEPYTELNLRRDIAALRVPGPDLDVTGPYLEGRDSIFPQMAVVTDAADARATVEFWSHEGVTSFKAYMNLAAAPLGAAIEAAHSLHRKVTGHLCAVDWPQAIALGIDDLEHGPIYTDSEFVPDRKPDVCAPGSAIRNSWKDRDIGSAAVQKLIRALVSHGVAVTSTLPVFAASISSRPLLSRRELDMMSMESQRSYLHARALAATHADEAADAERLLRKEMEFERAFARAGGLLLCGPDPTGNGGVLPGFGDQHAIELLVEAGFTPVEAIQIATANAARYLNALDRIGTIEPGKQADLVVINGDPGRAIADIEKVEMVFKNGRAYDPNKLLESARGMVGTR